MAQTKTITLKIIETGDVHGHFFPHDFIDNKPLQGTLARVNTYVERERQTYGDRLLLIDNGDMLQGQPVCYWSNFVVPQDENIAASVVNYMKYDAVTVGNHDIETGHGVYDKWMREVRCPVLGANIVDSMTQQPYVKPYVLLVREGVRIAILGMVTPTIPCWVNESLYDGLAFQEMVSCAKQWVHYIKEVEHADLIVGLLHSGWEGNIVLDNGVEENATKHVAEAVEGFDIIFFGHDHQARSERLKNPQGEEVPCLNPSCYALNVAAATVALTYTDGLLTAKTIQSEIVSMRHEAADERMMRHFGSRIEAAKRYAERRIGTFASAVYTRDCYFGSSAFADFVHNLQLHISGADISLNAPLSFDSRIEAGDVFVSDLFKLYRFENNLYVMKMTGREVRNLLEMSYGLWATTMTEPDDHLLQLDRRTHNGRQCVGIRHLTFNFDSAAGIDYEVDVTKPDGEKVRILRMTDGRPFDELHAYKVVMNSYRGNGGGELLTRGAGIAKEELRNRLISQSPQDLRHYLMEEIERQGTVSPKPNNNWRFVPEAWTRPAARRDRKLLFGN